MCGRFALATPAPVLAQQFEVALEGPFAPRYNIAPSQPILIVRMHGAAREAALVTWGLLPSWSDSPSAGARMINARAETVASKPAFRAAFRRRRCLVPASGYYEWQVRAGGKQPWFIHPADSECCAIAGVWEHWERDGSVIESCALLTCAPNARLRSIHDRMPVMLAPHAYAPWLDPATPNAALAPLMVAAADDAFDCHPVTRRVNSPRHDDAPCSEPVPLAD